ncbi:MAG TPA: NAD+ synthase [bacterium]|jgi:NAD+ synthase (glutamine-hydrolysing)|nr:NAD+ synthase [bacterium]
MKIALCQINTTVGDFDGNVAKVLENLGKARAAGCDIALFPELTLTGYPPRDLLDRFSFFERSRKSLEKVAQEAKGILAVVGTILENREAGNPLFNAAVAVTDGAILHVYRKVLLPNYDVFDEARYFMPAPGPEPPFKYKGLKIGVTICEDIWNVEGVFTHRLYAKDPVEELARSKPDLVLNLSASPFHHAKLSVRQSLLKDVTRKTHSPILYCNLVGGNDELIFDGCSMVMDAAGNLFQLGKSFEEDFFVYDTENPSVKPIPSPEGETAKIYQALVTGTRDYVRKCGFEKVLIGLSGGIDSALVACLAAEALGCENVMGVTMPSPFSSPGSIGDSHQLAEALGIEFKEIPITPLFEEALKTLQPLFKECPRDATEENLQARLRGLLLMALSNKFNRLVLSTGNKSEIAVGYCTLYGDMCGGLAVISDVPKGMVYELARFANRRKPVIPEATFTKAPSAELRPHQTDQDSLPPYETLDAVLRLYVEENQPPSKIVKAGFEAPLVREILGKINQNEYKRRQMAPGLKVTTKAFGMGRRVPIAQKFKEET